MKMKRMIAVLLTLMMISSLTACGGDKQEEAPEAPAQTETESEIATPEEQETQEVKEPEETQEPEELAPEVPTVEMVLGTYYYDATLNLPASEAEDGSLESAYVEEESTQSGGSDCGIANDTVAIELTYKSYTFQNNMYYQEKYGEQEPTYENYVGFMLDSSLQDCFTSGIEETKVGDYDAVKYINDWVYYSLHVEELPGQFMIFVIPLTEDADLEALAADPEINAIINSIKVEALNN